MTKIDPPPRRSLFAPRGKVPVDLNPEEKAARLQRKADRAEKPAKAKVDRKAVNGAADRAARDPGLEALAKNAKRKPGAPVAVPRDITVAAIKSPGKPPQLDPTGRATQLNVKMPPGLMKGLQKRAKADGVKPVVVVRRAVEAYLS